VTPEELANLAHLPRRVELRDGRLIHDQLGRVVQGRFLDSASERYPLVVLGACPGRLGTSPHR